MAPYNDSLYDGTCLYRFTVGLSRRPDVGVCLMDIQLIIALLLGLIAFIYIGKQMIKQFTQTEKDPKCDNCPVPDGIQEIRKKEKGS